MQEVFGKYFPKFSDMGCIRLRENRYYRGKILGEQPGAYPLTGLAIVQDCCNFALTFFCGQDKAPIRKLNRQLALFAGDTYNICIRNLTMPKETIDARYYENTDFSLYMKKSARKKIFGVKNRRVTMNISEEAFIDANKLDKVMNMGYQNVLKAAISIGLNDLHRLVHEKKNISRVFRKPARTAKLRKSIVNLR
jgi:hypothetical protein